MDPRYYTGSDDRDTLSPDYDFDRCDSCGAAHDQPCLPDCICPYCVGRRARVAAARALDILPEGEVA